jgi:hypothetical protein
MKRLTWEERWWPKVIKGDVSDCWIFAGALGRGGYGEFWDGESTDNPRSVGSHRWSYMKFVGPIPDGLDVLHHCDNPPCVNPSHLWVGTHAENMKDAVQKNRFQGPNAGGRHLSTCIMSWEKVREMRARFARGGVSRRELADEFGVEYSGTCKILKGTMWPE